MSAFNAIKMDGLGNDFVIFDARNKNLSFSKQEIIKIADRKFVGCDQVILVKNDTDSDACLSFFNSDGEEASACGNGSRCVSYLLAKEKNKNKIQIKTKSGILNSDILEEKIVRMNIGKPKFLWSEIPLSEKMEPQNLKIELSDLNNNSHKGGHAVNVGNPHAVFFVNNCDNFDLNKIGPEIENHKIFPEKCNVSLAEIKNKSLIKLKVWERGAGLTKACGTAACAAAAIAVKNKLTERKIDIKFELGILNIELDQNSNIFMQGPVSDIKNIKVVL
jgi:diaminopimelate epimerase|tara:strand:- start:2020 stop:2847 length:828 start_codon:yes stop_codon:yes gene_type:complete